MNNMYIKSNWLFVVYKVIFVLICGFGLAHHMREGRWSDFNYYTVLSNAACFVYFLTSLVLNIRRMTNNRHVVTIKPRIEGAIVFCITVTFLIYNFVLRPEMFKMGNDSNFYSALNMTQHYIVPILAIIDWLLFCPKGRWRRYDPAMWLLMPLTYFIYILIRAPFAGNIGNTSSPYPYSFIDIQAHGVTTVAVNVLWSALGMIVLAYLLYFIDKGILRVGRKIKHEQPQRER